MIKRLHQLMGTMFVFAILLSVCASLSMAQSSVQSSAKLERERLDRIMDAGTSVEEFRTEMKDYLTDLGNALSNFQAIPAVRNQYAKNGIDSVTAIERAKADFDKIPAEDLMKMREVYAKYPEWREAPRAIYEIIQKVSNKTYTKRATGKNPGDITSNVIITDACPSISATPSYADIAVTKTAESVAQGIMDALPTDALTVAAHAAASGVLTGLRAATLATETLRLQYEDCSRAAFEADIIGKVNAIPGQISTSTSTTATNISTSTSTTATNIGTSTSTTATNITNAKTEIITAVENAKTTIIVNANANKDELIRLHIGADLASTDSAVLVAAFMLPAAQGGYLELTRSVVFDALTKLAGKSTAQANAILAQGDALRNDGNYKGAYTAYRKAYKTATN